MFIKFDENDITYGFTPYYQLSCVNNQRYANVQRFKNIFFTHKRVSRRVTNYIRSTLYFVPHFARIITRAGREGGKPLEESRFCMSKCVSRAVQSVAARCLASPLETHDFNYPD